MGDVIDDTIAGDPRPGYDECVNPANGAVSMGGRNVGDLLNDNGITWGWFQGGFAPSARRPDGTAVCGRTHVNKAGATVTDYIQHHQPLQYYASTFNPHHLPPTSVPRIGHTDEANHQSDIDAFWRAAEHRNLPPLPYPPSASHHTAPPT